MTSRTLTTLRTPSAQSVQSVSAAQPANFDRFVIPALDVTTEGETLAEAKEMARDAIENVLACRRQLNLPIPEETGCETIEVGA